MAAEAARGKTSTFSIQMGGDTAAGRRSQRPSSGRPVSGRPTDRQQQHTAQKGAHMFNRSKSGMVSYEDLLVAQYLDDLRRQKSEIRTEKELPPSPYLQRLPHANLVYGRMARANRSHPHARRRPVSASVLNQSRRGSKPKIDAKFIADETLWDPATPREETHSLRKGRPASAPIKRSRPISGTSVGSVRSRRSRPGSAKSIFKRQPQIITACAYKNGTRDIFIHASAPNLKIFLEFVTEKLGLAFAARRIFLEDGVEVFDGADIPPRADVYISMGENYKDPFGTMKQNMIIRQGSKWSLQGIILPEDRKKRSKHRMSKRLKNLSQVNTMRIIIYKNGKSAEPHEIVVDPSKFDEFLQACTARLELRNFAKKAYDWEGNEITDLEDTPVLDDCLQNKGGQVRGPLWISSGDRFSPLGTQEFLVNIKQVIRQKLKNALFYKKEVTAAMEDDNMENVTLPSVKMMKPDELYFALDEAEAEVKQLKEVLAQLNKRLESLKEEAFKEEEMGASYRMTHIQEVKGDDRLLGRKGLRLKVLENGMQDGEFVHYFNLREAARGDGDKKQQLKRLLMRLLDELSHTVHASNCPQPRLNAVAQCIYNKYGKEITDVLSLKNDDTIWVSYGEPFVSPFTYCLEVFYDKANKGMSTQGSEHILRDPMVDPDLQALSKEHNRWEASIGFPIEYEYDETMYTSQESQEECDQQISYTEIDSRSTYLLLKENHGMVLYPELGMNEKPRRGHSESQLWIISKSGYIYNKGMPQLCLGVSDTRIEGRLFVREVGVEGFMVSLQKRMAGNPAQVWRFDPSGSISAQSHPQLVLTYLENKYGDDESYNENRPQGLLSGARVYLVVADPLSKKDAACQRFAVKQERMDNLGQWKHTDVANPEWNKQALSWPVTQDGELNEKYDWPMEGFILPFAPPLQTSSRKGSGFSALPARLSVLPNGASSTAGAVTVVGPNLTSMMKQEGREKKSDKGKKNRVQDNSNVTEGDDLNLHCLDFSVQELEFTMFLDSCTLILNLPFAARRLFDESGEEHFTLQSLKRDQVVFVSCGEGWSDPKLTREEQQRRILLSQLSSDVGKIRQYCSQRNPEGFLLEVEGRMAAGSRLMLGCQWKQEEEALAHQSEPESNVRQSSDRQDQDTEDTSGMTAHERAHLLSEQRQNALRWPWERVVNVSTSMDASDLEAQKYSDPQLYEKFKPKPTPAAPRDMFQRFVYEDGFIACSANRHLVLAASVQEGRNSEVVLAKRLPDDLSQRWTIHSNGEIRSRYNQKQVLTVSFPTDMNIKGGDSQPQPLVGCAITLQSRRLNQFGHAHQRWHYDAETGFISAFNTDLPDREITAANKSDVCTFAIAGPVEIDQPGYRAEISTRNKTKGLKVCVSCARAMRGRYKLQALPPNTPFACAMGEAKKHKLPSIGSFRVLNGKVDLSTHEAEITLQKWEEQLENLRQQTTVTIYKEINAARTVTTVKVMAYKNGEGRMRAGEIICGSTVEGILQQCMSRLGLNTSARRLYAEDGTILMDVDDIVEVAVNLYRNALADKLDAMLEGSGEGLDDNREEEERLHQLQQSATQEVDAMVSQALSNVQLFGEEGEDNERGQGEGGSLRANDNEEEEEEEEGGDGRAKTTPRTMEDGQGDTMEDNKIARRREQLLSRIELPPLDTILRYPIEVWVSSGKNFVAPEVVESKEENRRKKRAVRAQVCLELDVEKHCLRQMKGRRFKDKSPGAYRSTLSAAQPVVLEGHWQDATAEERHKHQSVHKLQNHLGEIQANQKREKSQVVGINLSGALYKQPVLKRAMVYPNGESPEHAVMVWGESLPELLQNATVKLGLWKGAKFFFTEDGKKIETVDDIQSEQLLCVSSGKPYIRPQALRTTVEVRANWGRARKQYGPGATDIGVNVQKNPKVNVDPFGPPELALPITQGEELKGASTA
ncbi:doublecortin domain-containing protein 1-like [Babylonia areolata]|uniref:doublecortin domain-containing protein 1-like n=1 Tax=Babylonia areolata TaxID=304850 RepID=UPI003FD0B58F